MRIYYHDYDKQFNINLGIDSANGKHFLDPIVLNPQILGNTSAGLVDCNASRLCSTLCKFGEVVWSYLVSDYIYDQPISTKTLSNVTRLQQSY